MSSPSKSNSPIEADGDLGTFRLQWIATLDGLTCLECLRRDGRVYEPSTLPPPPHKHCRCCTVPFTGTGPIGSRASIFGPVSDDEARLTRDALIRIAETRHRLVEEVEHIISASSCRNSLGVELLRMALSIADVAPQGTALDRILSGNCTDVRLVERVCAACIDSNRVTDAMTWLKSCCSANIARNIASLYWIQAAETFAADECSREAARACCREAIACDNLDCSSLLKVARAMNSAGDSLQALAIANRALELSPTSKAARSLIARISG